VGDAVVAVPRQGVRFQDRDEDQGDVRRHRAWIVEVSERGETSPILS
jgi:hypothetical protein